MDGSPDTDRGSRDAEASGFRWTVLFWVLGASLVFAIGTEAFTTQAITSFRGSDFYEHSAAIRALLEDGFPPPSPMVVSDAGSPRYMPHFVLLAALGRMLSFDALRTMALASTVNIALLVIGAFFFFRALFRDSRAPLYGLIVLVGSWYSAWMYSNVYQLHILFGIAAYPSIACVGLTMIALAVCIGVTRSPTVPAGRLLLLTVLLAYILLTHAVTAMMALTATALLALTAPGVRWKIRALLLTTTVAGCLLALLWPYFSVLEVILGTGGGQQSWVAHLGGSGGRDPIYVTDSFDLGAVMQTLGLAIAGLAAIVILLVKRRHLFIPLSALAMLVPFLLNFVTRIPLGSRFILLTVFFLQVGLVWMLLMVSPGYHERATPLRRPWLGQAPVILLLLLMVGHNLRLTDLHLRRALHGRTPGRPSDVVLRYRRMADLAGEGAVVIGHRLDTWPLPAFGVKIVDPKHINPLLPDTTERKLAANLFFSPEATFAERDEIIRRYRVTHVLVKGAPAPCLEAWFDGRQTDPGPVGDGYTLYSLHEPAR